MSTQNTPTIVHRVNQKGDIHTLEFCGRSGSGKAISVTLPGQHSFKQSVGDGKATILLGTLFLKIQRGKRTIARVVRPGQSFVLKEGDLVKPSCTVPVVTIGRNIK